MKLIEFAIGDVRRLNNAVDRRPTEQHLSIILQIRARMPKGCTDAGRIALRTAESGTIVVETNDHRMRWGYKVRLANGTMTIVGDAELFE